VERAAETAFRVDAVRIVAPELEGEHPRDIGPKGEKLEIEHHPHVAGERVGDAHGSFREFPRLAAFIEGLHGLKAALDLADVVEVVPHPPPVRGTEVPLEASHRFPQTVEDAAVLRAPGPPLRRSRTRAEDAEEFIERDPRVADHGQGLGR
jgi:hypothetical protein